MNDRLTGARVTGLPRNPDRFENPFRTGRRFWPADPTLEQVHPESIV